MNRSSPNPYNHWHKWNEVHRNLFFVTRIASSDAVASIWTYYKIFKWVWPRLKSSMGSTFGKETLHKGRWNMVGLIWTLDASGQNATLFFKNHPRHQTGSRHWSVVSCVRCGCVGAGLGFPVGASAPLLLTPPTSDKLKWTFGSPFCSQARLFIKRRQTQTETLRIP